MNVKFRLDVISKLIKQNQKLIDKFVDLDAQIKANQAVIRDELILINDALSNETDKYYKVDPNNLDSD